MTEPFLSNLGISALDQLQYPSADAIPPAFNANCSAEWSYLVNKAKELKLDTNAAWGFCVKTFVSLCVEQNKFPFMKNPNEVNQSILSSLQIQRNAVISFLTTNADLAKVIKTTTVSRTNRSIEFIDSGFIITCSARIRFNYLEASKLAELLGFSKVAEGYYRKDVGSGVSVNLQPVLENAEYTVISYTIKSNILPFIANNYIPSKNEYSKFILDVMYIPLIRMSSPSIFSSNLF